MSPEGLIVEDSAAYGFQRDVLRSVVQVHHYISIVDMAGAASIKAYSRETVSIAIRPECPHDLKARLTSRAREGDDLEHRLGLAQKELEIIESGFFHHVIVNDELSRTVEQLEVVIKSELV